MNILSYFLASGEILIVQFHHFEEMVSNFGTQPFSWIIKSPENSGLHNMKSELL